MASIMNVAIVGASGRIGSYYAEALIKNGKHSVTALTREGSSSTAPAGARVARVDYSDRSSIASALKSQDCLIITLPAAPQEGLHDRIVAAAGDAGVKYVIPNIHGVDTLNESIRKDFPHGSGVLPMLESVNKAGASWIAIICGYWYEWSLSMGEQWFGFDIPAKHVTFFDDGTTRINASTWPQCGRAMAALLSLPEESTGSGPSLADYKNKPVYFDSFLISQRDMLDSIHRVRGTSDADWTISHEKSDERYQNGWAELKQGIRLGFAKIIYSRVFFPNGGGDYTAKGLANQALGLPKEDLDEETRKVLDLVDQGWKPMSF